MRFIPTITKTQKEKNDENSRRLPKQDPNELNLILCRIINSLRSQKQKTKRVPKIEERNKNGVFQVLQVKEGKYTCISSSKFKVIGSGKIGYIGRGKR